MPATPGGERSAEATPQQELLTCTSQKIMAGKGRETGQRASVGWKPAFWRQNNVPVSCVASGDRIWVF